MQIDIIRTASRKVWTLSLAGAKEAQQVLKQTHQPTS